MADPLRPLRINAYELLRQPGSEREVAVELPAPALGVEHERLGSGAETPVVVAARLVATNDSIDVTGSVSVDAIGECRRCLEPVRGVVAIPVEERYQIEITDPDAFAIENGQLDLAPMAREVVLLELDDDVMCRPDCAGLCPSCGADRNTTQCDCDNEIRDVRWSALADLDLAEPSDD